MPITEVVFYQDSDGVAPALNWVLQQPHAVQDKLWVAIERLEQLGYELRRPESAPLRDKIYELRIKHRRVHYRLLYFFHGTIAAVLAHGCTKEDAVDTADIDRAMA